MGFVDPTVCAVMNEKLGESVRVLKGIVGLIVKIGLWVANQISNILVITRQNIALQCPMKWTFMDMTMDLPLKITHINNVRNCAWRCASAWDFSTALPQRMATFGVTQRLSC